MSNYKEESDAEIKKREYLKQQHQLRTMTKSNNVLSADDMIENLLSKKEIFKMKKDLDPPSSKKPQTLTYPQWIYPGNEPLLYKRVWELVVTPTGYADTPKLTSILLTSRLSTEVLGYIWSLSNVALGPALSQLETYTSLALVALVQSGYSFTSAAVLNTLKEAPLPKLECPITEGPVAMPGTAVTMSPVVGVNPPYVLSVLPTVTPAPQAVPNMSSTYPANVFSSVKEIEAKPTEPKLLVEAGPSSVITLSKELSLLDIDLSLPTSAKSSGLPKPVVATSPSLLESGNSIDLTSNEPQILSFKAQGDKDLISEFSPSKNKNNVTPKVNDCNESRSLVDDLFGDFQSVNPPVSQMNSQLPSQNDVDDDDEFDDFKSADFTNFEHLEVKEKPPEENTIKQVNTSTFQKEEKSNIEDLFPKCMLAGSRKEENTHDLLASDEDKYSALRSLTESRENHDDFGDFLTATPSQPASLPPPFPSLQNNIQEKAMEACLEIMEEARRIFSGIGKEDVLKKVMADPRGINYLEEIIEVERIALRIKSHLDNEDLKKRLHNLSSSLEQYLVPHRNSYMPEENGPKCGICLCERGPCYVKYGLNNFHAPCANLYIHKVDSNLPIAPVM